MAAALPGIYLHRATFLLYRHLTRTLGPIVRAYAGVTLRGEQHLPAARKRAILACNHAGSLWWDALCLAAGLRNRQISFVAHHWDAQQKILASFLRRVDALGMPAEFADITPDHPIIESLAAEKLLCVYPEESYHTFRDRYTLFDFNPQIIRYAQLTGAPIVPTAMIGVEEAAATLFGWKKKGVPWHFPWVPPVILPWRVTIEFAAPVTFEELTGCEREGALQQEDYRRGAYNLRERLRATISSHRTCRVKDVPYLEVASLW
jgi:1-acyl-sn-glycerol-3-phosphate acyltransferase